MKVGAVGRHEEGRQSVSLAVNHEEKIFVMSEVSTGPVLLVFGILGAVLLPLHTSIYF